MRLHDIELAVLVKDRPITEYPHSGNVYVEGRAGSEYQIEVKNHSYQRVEAVISVDGLSVLNGKPAGTDSTGYVIKAYDTLRVPGWTLNTQSVANFTFSGKESSYATQMTGDSRNNGVIGLMVFKEKSEYWCATSVSTPWVDATTVPTTSSPSWATWSSTTNMGYSGISQGITTGAVTSDMVSRSLGTGFGDASKFATMNVLFTRAAGAPLLLTIYYDERRGLKARGIRIGRPFKPQGQPLPQAFPGIGCTPPPGWQG